MRFAAHDGASVVIEFDRTSFLHYRESRTGNWSHAVESRSSQATRKHANVRFRQGLDQPPELVASLGSEAPEAVVWDPNPQLKNIQLGTVELVEWTGPKGHGWKADLVRPPGNPASPTFCFSDAATADEAG